MTDQKELRIALIRFLMNEGPRRNMPIPDDEPSQKDLLRGLMNIRPSGPIPDDILDVQNEYLEHELAVRGTVGLEDMRAYPDGIYLWQGDITRIKADAIVNAANSGMTGCYVPNHKCIDNCIHTFGGMQMRLECAKIMERQGFPEPTGLAKITPGYCLPSKYVIHTVGPIVDGSLTEEHCRLLRSCYISCLELADSKGLESIAFCCISTGVFRFPNEMAARIAIDTVREYKRKTSSGISVIFNVFLDKDLGIYEKLLDR